MTGGFLGFPERDQSEIPVAGETVLYVWPILKGEEEAWRRVMQEIQTSRRIEYAESRRRLGFRRESIHLAHIDRRHMAIIIIEVEAPEKVFPMMAASEHPFDRWYVAQVLELHGIDLLEMPSALKTHQILAWQARVRPVKGDSEGD